MIELLAIAGAAEQDDALAAEVAALAPEAVTVVIESDESSERWWSGAGERELALRDRLATLLARIEDATGAAVVGLVAAHRDAARLAVRGFDGVVRPGPRAVAV